MKGMKNYFIVNPEGNPNDIVLSFEGATNISISTDGELIISAQIGDIKFEKPHCYQINPAGNVVPMPWQGNYILLAGNKVKFDLMNYPHNMPLFIQMDQGHKQPVEKSIDNLMWSTYYGGLDEDYIYDVDTDNSGNVFFTGYSRGLTFPYATQIIYNNGISNNGRMIIGKHKPLGERAWSTLYGAQSDIAYGIAVDNSHNVYIVGVTGVGSEPNHFLNYTQSGAFNMAPLSTTVSAAYGTILKFNQSTGQRTWATLTGEHNSNAFFQNQCIEIDPWGHVYVAGKGKRVSSSPLVASGVQYLQTTTGITTGQIMKFDGTTNALIWSTMFGNNGLSIEEMNITSIGDVFIVGSTSGTNTSLFPSSVEKINDYQQTYGGGTKDAFFAKFNKFEELKWSSFLGGAGEDIGWGIDYSENAHSLFISGQTSSDNSTFPLMELSSPSVHYSGTLNNQDGFVTVLRDLIGVAVDDPSSNGHVLKYSTYFGGSSEDLCGNLEISPSGKVYLLGMSKSTNLPLHQTTNAYYQPVLENNPTGIHFDSFILGLNEYLQFEWSTFYGGERYSLGSNATVSSNDNGAGLALFNDQILYIGGYTNSDDLFPITVDLVSSPNAFIQYENSGSATDTPLSNVDGFLAQFDLTNLILSVNENEQELKNIDLNIFPNPSSGEFTLQATILGFNGIMKIEVNNIIGQNIYSSMDSINNGILSHTFNLENCKSGMYVVKLTSRNKSFSKKIIIK